MKRTVKLKSIRTENGKLYCTIGEQRFFFAGCEARIDICEEQTDLPLLNVGTVMHRRRFYLALCGELDPVREADEASLRRVTAFDLTAEAEERDGTFTRFALHDLLPVRIDLSGGEWVFEAPRVPEWLQALAREE